MSNIRLAGSVVSNPLDGLCATALFDWPAVGPSVGLSVDSSRVSMVGLRFVGLAVGLTMVGL